MKKRHQTNRIPFPWKDNGATGPIVSDPGIEEEGGWTAVFVFAPDEEGGDVWLERVGAGEGPAAGAL
jgi:hypothetical protein